MGQKTEAAAIGAAPIGGHWSAATGYTLAFLTLISAFNYLDRGILGLAFPLIKREWLVSDTALGLASGLAFALFYTLLGLPIAWLADRWSRRNIIAIGFGFWSLMTALTGMAANIWQLAGARFLMGAGEACGLAPSTSMISDLFRERRRPIALAVLGTASSISSIALYPVVGWIGQHHGWRAMFTASALPGFVLAAIFLLTVREPTRGATEATRPADAGSARDALAPLPATLRFLLGSRTYTLMLVGSMLMGASAYAGSTWNPSFLTRVHHMRVADVAASIGPLQGLCGAAGMLLGGLLVDALGRRDYRWTLRLPALLCLLAAPAEVLFLLGGSRAAWMIGFGLVSFFSLAHQAPVFAAALSIARVHMRAVAISVLVLVAGLLGQITGPVLVGWLNDELQTALGHVAVRYSLLLVAFCMAGGGLVYLAAIRHLLEDRQRAGS